MFHYHVAFHAPRRVSARSDPRQEPTHLGSSAIRYRYRSTGSILEVHDMTIPAKYKNGIFKPLRDVPLEEKTIVEVYVPVEASAKRSRSIGDLPLAGMCKDREDIAVLMDVSLRRPMLNHIVFMCSIRSSPPPPWRCHSRSLPSIESTIR